MNLKRVLLLVCLAAVHSAAASQTLECNVGPVTRSYGNTDWLVYSCSDRKSLVLVSAPGSPAMSTAILISIEYYVMARFIVC